MRTALIVLMVCAAADLIACLALVAFVWLDYRRVRREAAAAGTPLPSAAGPLGCLAASALIGLTVLYATVWLLLTV